MHCGQPLAPAQAPAAAAPANPGPVPGMFADARNAKRKSLATAAVVAIVLLLAAILGLKASGLLRLGSTSPDIATLKASGANSNQDSLKAEASLPMPTLHKEAKTDKPLTMPKDVEDWLKHLERIERKKCELTLQQIANLKVFQQELSVLGPGIGSMDPYDQTIDGGQDPQHVVKGKFADLRPQWNDLIKEFNSVPPPEECKPLADDYFHALNEIPAETADIMDVLNQVTGNPQQALVSAEKLKNRSFAEIDKPFQQADQRLQAICDKYGKSKWFNIKTDVAGTDQLGKMGF